MKSIKNIMPSLKEKKRYLTFEISSENKITGFSAINGELKQGIIKSIGILGAAKAGIQILHEKWNEQSQMGIIRVNHKYVNELKSSLIMIATINRQKVIIRSLTVTGTLRKASSLI